MMQEINGITLSLLTISAALAATSIIALVALTRQCRRNYDLHETMRDLEADLDDRNDDLVVLQDRINAMQEECSQSRASAQQTHDDYLNAKRYAEMLERSNGSLRIRYDMLPNKLVYVRDDEQHYRFVVETEDDIVIRTINYRGSDHTSEYYCDTEQSREEAKYQADTLADMLNLPLSPLPF